MPPSPAGQPAGCVLPYSAADADDDGNELRVAFDFDGVLAGDSAERNFRRMQQEDPDNALEQYAEYEREHADQPIEGGRSNDCSPASTPCRKPPPAAQWKASRRCECI